MGKYVIVIYFNISVSHWNHRNVSIKTLGLLLITKHYNYEVSIENINIYRILI